MVSYKTEITKKPYRILFTHVTSLFQPISYAKNDDRQQVKYRATNIAFPFSLFLLISKQKVESVNRVCAYREMKQNV